MTVSRLCLDSDSLNRKHFPALCMLLHAVLPTGLKPDQLPGWVCFSPYAHTVLGLSEEPATVASWEVGFVYSGCTALSKYCCVNGTTTRAAPGRFVLQRHSSKAQLLFCLLLGSNPRALVIYCRPRQSMTSCTTRAQSLWPVSRAGTKTLIIPHPSRGRVSGQVPHLLLWVQTQGLGNPCQVF